MTLLAIIAVALVLEAILSPRPPPDPWPVIRVSRVRSKKETQHARVSQ